VSLPTRIAGDLGLSEGQAGQAISISGLFAVITSLFIAGLTRGIDRKVVLAGFSLLLIVSGTIVTLAPNHAALMLGRALLGVAIGGFWTMSTAIVIRLLRPPPLFERAHPPRPSRRRVRAAAHAR
jgi:predicted MFS family arabinose efflux permease